MTQAGTVYNYAHPHLINWCSNKASRSYPNRPTNIIDYNSWLQYQVILINTCHVCRYSRFIMRHEAFCRSALHDLFGRWAGSGWPIPMATRVLLALRPGVLSKLQVPLESSANRPHILSERFGGFGVLSAPPVCQYYPVWHGSPPSPFKKAVVYFA